MLSDFVARFIDLTLIQVYLSIVTTLKEVPPITSDNLKLHDGWFFQLFDLLLHHHLEGLVVDEAW